MITTWKTEKAWSDVLIPETREILGRYLVAVPPDIEDQQHNTDLIVMVSGKNRIACRTRRNKYLAEYSKEFTIRAMTKTGQRTEINKVLEDGWGDLLFYGFADEPGLKLVQWFIGDLDVFRSAIRDFQTKNPGFMPGWFKQNDDGTGLWAFPLRLMPPEFILDSSWT